MHHLCMVSFDKLFLILKNIAKFPVPINFQLHHWYCLWIPFSSPGDLECDLCRGLCKINVLLCIIEVVELTRLLGHIYNGYHSFFRIISIKTFYYIKLHYYRMKRINITTLRPWKWKTIDDNRNKIKAFRRDTING